MTKLRVIMGFAAAATVTMTAVDNVEADHLRASGDQRALAEKAEETAFLDSFTSAESDSQTDDYYADDYTGESNDDDLYGIVEENSSDREPTTSPADDNTPEPIDTTDTLTESPAKAETPTSKDPLATTATTTPTADVTDASVSDVPTELPATEVPSTSTSASAASASEAPAATEPVGSHSAATETPTADATDASVSDASSPVPTTDSTPLQLGEVAAWDQCGGLNFDYTKYFADGVSANWSTKLTCTQGYQCEIINPWYFQCQALKGSEATANLWAQCGGLDYHGLTNCATGAVCKFHNAWYSQCIPTDNA